MFEEVAKEKSENYFKKWADRYDLENMWENGAEFGYNKANEYAKVIIQDLLDNSDEYARQRAYDFLEESNK